ncbi:MAG: hypothetical protein ACYTFW_00605 [Planctomycetota bacterium]|jgi:hypothetical protein
MSQNQIPEHLKDQPWFEVMMEEVVPAAEVKRDADQRRKRLYKYRDDPVSFGIEVLRESYTGGVQEVMCSVRDNPITIARSANAVGKSHGAARIAAWFFSVFDDSKVFITAAPPVENLKRILWGELLSIIERNEEFFAGFQQRSMKINRNASSFVDCLTIPTSGTIENREAKFSGKHAPHMLFIVDEGDAVPDEVYRGIESCMSGGMARMLIMFNPRSPTGPVYIKERDGLANVVHLSAFDHPNVVTGEDVYPGAVDRETTVRRINQWTKEIRPEEKPNEEEMFDVPDFLVGYVATSLDGKEYPPLPAGKRVIVDPEFSYMVLGLYPPQGESQLINRAWVEEAQARWRVYVDLHGEVPPKDIKPILAIDVAELGTDNNVACRRYASYVPRMDFWSGIDTDQSAVHARQLYHKYDARILHIDGTGIGSSVAPSVIRMERDDNPKSEMRAVTVKVAGKPTPGSAIEQGEFYQLRDQLWWAVRDWLREDPTAMLPPDPYLAEELCTPTYSIPPQHGRIKVLGKDELRLKLKRSPDRADALCLTFVPEQKAKVMKVIDSPHKESRGRVRAHA